jgi:NTE family protein
MGLTIVHKSDLTVRKRDPKVALVLAGGAITGGAYKLGGLKALDDFLVHRKTTDFDLYVGLSAGSFLAAPLAGGVAPPEMLRALEGTSDVFSQFTAADFYRPNLEEFLSKPLDFFVDLLSYAPGLVWDFLVQTPQLIRRLEAQVDDARRAPTFESLLACITPLVDAVGSARAFPFPLAYLPSGLCDNSGLERYLRRNVERNHMTNDFRVLQQTRQRELYIVAMNLDTAERAVFGHDADTSLTISEAVQASTALPGFYKPARLHGVDYVDGGVRRTANIDVAIEHGADLVICYNPFRPFTNDLTRQFDSATGRYEVRGRPLADQGLLTVLNQVFRTLLHSRLQLGIRAYQEDPSFRGDIILIEPEESDRTFFQMAPLSLWAGGSAGAHGYVSVTQCIETHYGLLKTILRSYGLDMSRRRVEAGLKQMLTETAAGPGSLRDEERSSRHVA